MNNFIGVENEVSKKTSNTTTTPATREQVLKACRTTSGALAAAGIIIRQVFFSPFSNEVNISNYGFDYYLDGLSYSYLSLLI